MVFFIIKGPGLT